MLHHLHPTRYWSLLALIVGGLLMSACGAGSAAPAAPTADAAAPSSATVAPAPLATPAEAVPTLAPVLAGNGIIPAEMLAAMIADLASRAGVPPTEVSVLKAEAVTWPDGSLGCPREGMLYPQVLIDGFRATLSAAGSEYAYHGDGRGNFVYCANPAP